LYVEDDGGGKVRQSDDEPFDTPLLLLLLLAAPSGSALKPQKGSTKKKSIKIHAALRKNEKKRESGVEVAWS
jgi:hypothetical protein